MVGTCGKKLCKWRRLPTHVGRFDSGTRQLSGSSMAPVRCRAARLVRVQCPGSRRIAAGVSPGGLCWSALMHGARGALLEQSGAYPARQRSAVLLPIGQWRSS